MRGNNGLEEQQYSRGFLVGGGSVRPRYGLFSASSLRLYFCRPPRTRSRRTPVLRKAPETQREGFISPRLDLNTRAKHTHTQPKVCVLILPFCITSRIKRGASAAVLIHGWWKDSRTVRVWECVWGFWRMWCVLPSMCGCVSAAAAFPYVVNAWLVYCDTAEPRAGLNIWIFNAGSMISKTGPLII